MRVSIRTLLTVVAGVAIVLAFWTRFGEYMIALAFMILLIGIATSFLLPKHESVRKYRRRATIAMAVLLLFIASLGPATLAYTSYDPDLYQSPTSQRLLLRVYAPVGSCLSFPTGALRDGYLAYLRFWTPRGIAIQDLGWGVKVKNKHQHFYIGMN